MHALLGGDAEAHILLRTVGVCTEHVSPFYHRIRTHTYVRMQPPLLDVRTLRTTPHSLHGWLPTAGVGSLNRFGEACQKEPWKPSRKNSCCC